VSYRELLDAAPDAIVVVNRAGRIVFVNDQAVAQFGYSRRDLVGRPVEVLAPLRAREGHVARRTDYFRDPRPRPMGIGLELSARRKDGTEFPAEISLAPLKTPGGVLVLAAVRDVTGRIRLEEQRRRAAEDASRIKSEFLANMSHELRTPLNAIIGFAELMEAGTVGPVSAEHKEYLGDILSAARHLLQLINDILDLAKVEAGRMEFRPVETALDAVTRETCDGLRPLAGARRISLSVTVADALGRVWTDPARLRQVITNFVSNAIKFTPEGGRVEVRVSPEGADAFRIEVEDTGPGIAPDDVKRLFTEFTQLDTGPGRRQQGTGLGLALTRRIVEAQGGRVEVRSVVGQGSVFSAVLPRVGAAAVSAEG
jgi:PAS domain S-box-containing protein